ncbi:CRISPR system Cascade subunit CasB [Amaricoccus macauensis]|uniref:CRISPR system Cascade subunit CasB n=1 Tax=Amaricoccus macauensis TaxID=57001 RepID=A0A840SZ02_9RHOB|nr:type I-E CRISPR-associated protein Cse2/CasB [Amaricoccus macauensis]MBB5224292.1 CRISPR system Cascade subunit CasB [Amaricoccus macauensis]
MSAAEDDKTPARIILGWWSHALADRQSGRARALAARLRRASPVEALAEREVHDLAGALNLRDGLRLTRIVTLLAEVRTHSPQTLMQRLGGPDPALSPLRFQRLMRASVEELPDALRRAIGLAERSCNVAALGEDLLYWSEKTRLRWSFQYFGGAAPLSLSIGSPSGGTPSKETTE